MFAAFGKNGIPYPVKHKDEVDPTKGSDQMSELEHQLTYLGEFGHQSPREEVATKPTSILVHEPRVDKTDYSKRQSDIENRSGVKSGYRVGGFDFLKFWGYA